MPTPLYILRAHWAENYDCPDNGHTKICDAYEDLYVSSDRIRLESIAANLREGHRGTYWSEKRANELRKLHAGYDDFRETAYAVHDVSGIVI